MTNQETKQLAKTLAHGSVLGKNYLARAISAMIRSARNNRSKIELSRIAADIGCQQHPEFIV
jgi:ribosomal protein L18E